MAKQTQTGKNAQRSERSEATTTYLMDLPGGKMRRITVPSEWKVTFGPLVPHRPGDRNYEHHKTFALRFYEAENKQRAIFTDVIAFRDEALAVMERVTKVKQQVVEKAAPGGKSGMVVEARITEWRDPLAPEADNQDDDFLKLTQPKKEW